MSAEQKREFDEEVIADQVVLSQAGANSIRAERVDMQQAGAVSIMADKVAMDGSGAVLIRSQDADLSHSGCWLVVADRLSADDTSTGFLIARSIEGSVSTVLDTKTAFALGAGIGAGLALFWSLLRWLGGRRHR
ncbi:MAG: hypothetical protein M1358_01750 [Chloroflexi bacterium]|nr:hypothetical protein [Chloroflexota bacterium]